MVGINLATLALLSRGFTINSCPKNLNPLRHSTLWVTLTCSVLSTPKMQTWHSASLKFSSEYLPTGESLFARYVMEQQGSIKDRNEPCKTTTTSQKAFLWGDKEESKYYAPWNHWSERRNPEKCSMFSTLALVWTDTFLWLLRPSKGHTFVQCGLHSSGNNSQLLSLETLFALFF